MKISYPNYYFDFHCIGGSCEATCCKGWKIQIDDDSLKRYKKIKGPFARKIKEGILWKESCFQLKDQRCAMLNEDGWCDLQIAMGESALCKTCKTFPRHQEDFGILQEKMLSLSCPEAARLILFSQKPVTYFLREKEEPIEVTRKRERGISSTLRKSLLAVRQTIESIYKNQEIPLHVRKIMVTYLVHDVQLRLEQKHYDKVEDVLVRYEKKSAAAWFIERFSIEPTDGEIQKKRKQLLHIYRNLELVWPDWKKNVQKMANLQNAWERQPIACREKMDRVGVWFEGIEQARVNLYLYFLHTWFLGALYDEQIEVKMKLILASCEMIEELALANWLENNEMQKDKKQIWTQAAWMYARQIEHSDDNLERLETVLP